MLAGAGSPIQTRLRQFSDPGVPNRAGPRPHTADTLSADARPRRHQLRARRRRPAARALGARPDRGAAPPRDRGRGLQLPAGLAPVPPGDAAAAPPAARGAASTSSTPTTAWPAGARSWPAPGRWSSPSTAPTSATRSSARSRAACLAHRPGRRRLAGALRRRRTAGPGLPLRATARRSCPAAPTSAASARCPAPRRAASWASTPTAATCSSPPTPTRPEKRADRAARARRRLRRRAAHRRLDRARADAALDQRRQRRPRHLRLRGLRDDLHRGARLRGAGPLHPGRHRALRSSTASTAPSAPPSSSPPGGPRRVPTWSPPTPGSPAPRGPRWLSAERMAERTIEAYRDVLAAS